MTSESLHKVHFVKEMRSPARRRSSCMQRNSAANDGRGMGRAVKCLSVWVVPTGIAPPTIERHSQVAAISQELFKQGLGVGYPVEAGYALGRTSPSQIRCESQRMRMIHRGTAPPVALMFGTQRLACQTL